MVKPPEGDGSPMPLAVEAGPEGINSGDQARLVIAADLS
jgi:hypothetical protein